MDPAQLRAALGIDELPKVLDPAAFSAAMRSHAPRRPAGEGADVLVEVSLDAEGNVVDARAIRPGDLPGGAPRQLGGERVEMRAPPPEIADALEAAAVATLREVRFSPARRDGEAVPFTLRMTLSFRPADS